MGVSLLEKFMEHDKPNSYCHEVSIEDLARRYTQETGKVPVMVVDGTCFLYEVYKPEINDWLMGGRLLECIANIKGFIAAFQKIDVDLLFYFDGATPQKKRDLWISRRKQRLSAIQKIFDYMKGITSKNSDIWKKISITQQPPLIGAIGRFIVKYACANEVKVRIAVGECDGEIATFAKQENCFAILSQDTDFVILDGANHYLSARRMDLETMTTLKYDGRALAEELSLHFNQLPLLASLLGNDYLASCDLLRYHCRKIKKKRFSRSLDDTRELIASIASYVKGLPTGPKLSAILPRVAAEELKNKAFTEALQESVRSYTKPSTFGVISNGCQNTDGERNEVWQKILQVARKKHIKCQVPPQIYNIMLGYPFELSQCLEDLKSRQLPCSAMAYQRLRSRVYSILLREKPGDNLTVEEWCIYSYETIEPKNVYIEQLPNGAYHPGLLALWGGTTSQVNDQRWKLFIKSVDQSLVTAQIRNLPLRYVVPALVLFHVKKEWSIFEEWEVDAFLSMAVTLGTMNDSHLTALEAIDKPPARAVECSTLYSRGITTMLLLMAACGFSLKETKFLKMFRVLRSIVYPCHKATEGDKTSEGSSNEDR